VAVITARHDVPAGRSITSADVDNVQLPRAAVPPGAVTELVGDAVATHHIGPREVITEADVGIGSTEAAVVGPGRRGLFVPWAPGVPTMSTGTPVELIVLAPIDPLGQASGSPEILGRGVVVAATDQGVLVSVTAQQSADAAAAVASGQLTLAVIGG
jgi:Flp pilus assembly protein CpaB